MMPLSRTQQRSTRTRQADLGLDARGLCAALRTVQTASLLLDGSGAFSDSWTTGTLVAVQPRRRDQSLQGAGADRLLDEIDRRVESRRSAGGSAATGVAVLLPYEALSEGRSITLLEVDRSVRFAAGELPLISVRGSPGGNEAEADEEAEHLAEWLGSLDDPGARQGAARCLGEPRTSLPRERYLRAVDEVRSLIAQGEIYQANLCQRFTTEYRGDAFALYRELVERSPAPMSAFFESDGFALASVSPEIFLRGDREGGIATYPIKGTRPRGEDRATDDAARRELLASAKDRAELLMIVDLERNDLGRVCRIGSIRVPELAALRSFPEVHHLVARVEGRLKPGTTPGDLLRATFPGGSITGAPKIRAMQVLDRLEPVPRSFFTGSMFWFGDDGSLDSSILIRTLEFRAGQAWLGAGGGIVSDSDPEQEWRESNHKAAALARALGFHPEQAR